LHSEAQTGRNKLKHNPVPYWNEQCKTAVYARNRARNKLNNKITPVNVENYKKKAEAKKLLKKQPVSTGKNFVVL